MVRTNWPASSPLNQMTKAKPPVSRQLSLISHEFSVSWAWIEKTPSCGRHPRLQRQLDLGQREDRAGQGHAGQPEEVDLEAVVNLDGEDDRP